MANPFESDTFAQQPPPAQPPQREPLIVPVPAPQPAAQPAPQPAAAPTPAPQTPAPQPGTYGPDGRPVLTPEGYTRPRPAMSWMETLGIQEPSLEQKYWDAEQYAAHDPTPPNRLSNGGTITFTSNTKEGQAQEKADAEAKLTAFYQQQAVEHKQSVNAGDKIYTPDGKVYDNTGIVGSPLAHLAAAGHPDLAANLGSVARAGSYAGSAAASTWLDPFIAGVELLHHRLGDEYDQAHPFTGIAQKIQTETGTPGLPEDASTLRRVLEIAGGGIGRGGAGAVAEHGLTSTGLKGVGAETAKQLAGATLGEGATQAAGWVGETIGFKPELQYLAGMAAGGAPMGAGEGIARHLAGKYAKEPTIPAEDRSRFLNWHNPENSFVGPPEQLPAGQAPGPFGGGVSAALQGRGDQGPSLMDLRRGTAAPDTSGRPGYIYPGQTRAVPTGPNAPPLPEGSAADLWRAGQESDIRNSFMSMANRKGQQLGASLSAFPGSGAPMAEANLRVANDLQRASRAAAEQIYGGELPHDISRASITDELKAGARAAIPAAEDYHSRLMEPVNALMQQHLAQTGQGVRGGPFFARHEDIQVDPGATDAQKSALGPWASQVEANSPHSWDWWQSSHAGHAVPHPTTSYADRPITWDLAKGMRREIGSAMGKDTPSGTPGFHQMGLGKGDLRDAMRDATVQAGMGPNDWDYIRSRISSEQPDLATYRGMVGSQFGDTGISATPEAKGATVYNRLERAHQDPSELDPLFGQHYPAGNRDRAFAMHLASLGQAAGGAYRGEHAGEKLTPGVLPQNMDAQTRLAMTNPSGNTPEASQTFDNVAKISRNIVPPVQRLGLGQMLASHGVIGAGIHALGALGPFAGHWAAKKLEDPQFLARMAGEHPSWLADIQQVAPRMSALVNMNRGGTNSQAAMWGHDWLPSVYMGLKYLFGGHGESDQGGTSVH